MAFACVTILHEIGGWLLLTFIRIVIKGYLDLITEHRLELPFKNFLRSSGPPPLYSTDLIALSDWRITFNCTTSEMLRAESFPGVSVWSL